MLHALFGCLLAATVAHAAVPMLLPRPTPPPPLADPKHITPSNPVVFEAALALRDYLNAHRAACPAPLFAEVTEVTHARFAGEGRGAGEPGTMSKQKGSGKPVIVILLEARMDASTIFHARMAQAADTLAWSVVGESVVPPPCTTGPAAMLTHAMVDSVNAAGLAWNARMYPSMEGRILMHTTAPIEVVVGGAATGAAAVKARRALTSASPATTTAKPATTTAKPTAKPTTTTTAKPATTTTAKPKTTTTAAKPTTTTHKPTTTTAPHTTPTPPLPMPAAYDARDYLVTDAACAAFTARDQGPCTWCTAFATTTMLGARMCLRYGRNTSRTNTVFSAQQDGDCVVGDCATAGASNYAGPNYYTAPGTPLVEEWCSPFLSANGASCAASAAACAARSAAVYSAVGAPVSQVGVHSYAYEVLMNGPGVVSIDFYNDLFGYATGVYSPSASASYVAGHALVVVGWGVDGALPYWICQSSYGAGWGEGGYVRMLRGTDVCSMESRGMVVLTPNNPSSPPAGACPPLTSHTLADGSCACVNQWAGPACDVCNAGACQNGGVMRAADCACTCPLGTAGALCELGVAFTRDAAYAGDTTPLSIAFNYGDGTVVAPPPPGSVFYMCASNAQCANVYSSAATQVTFVCNTPTSCPQVGALNLPVPATPDTYTLAFVAPVYNPSVGTYFPPASTFFGTFAVVDPASPTAADDLAAGAAAAHATRLLPPPSPSPPDFASMAARLAAAASFAAASQPPPTVTLFTGASGVIMRYAVGQQLCYALPPNLNAPQKAVVPYIGGVDGVSYPAVVDAAWDQTAAATCINLAFAGYTASATAPFTLRLLDTRDSAASVLLATAPFLLFNVKFGYTGVTNGATSVTLPFYWTWDVGTPHLNDTIKIMSTASNTVYYWFYTYCSCTTPPSPATDTPSAAGTGKIVIPKSAGAYPIFFYSGLASPSAGGVPTAFMPPWTSLGFT